MLRLLWLILVAGLLTPVFGRTALAGDEPAGQRRAEKATVSDASINQVPVSDASVNRQILQTLTDIRDSQLSVLQAQVEILSILRAQEKAPPPAAAQHDDTPASAHRSERKGHKRKPETSLSAAR